MDSAKAMVVSDDREMQRALADRLASSGLTPLLALTVSEAVAVLKNPEIVVILSSEELPDGSFCDILRLSRADSRIPVIVFSRLADWDAYLNVVRTGAFDYVRYPPSQGEIERVVWNALSFVPREEPKSFACTA